MRREGAPCLVFGSSGVFGIVFMSRMFQTAMRLSTLADAADDLQNHIVCRDSLSHLGRVSPVRTPAEKFGDNSAPRKRRNQRDIQGLSGNGPLASWVSPPPPRRTKPTVLRSQSVPFRRVVPYSGFGPSFWWQTQICFQNRKTTDETPCGSTAHACCFSTSVYEFASCTGKSMFQTHRTLIETGSLFLTLCFVTLAESMQKKTGRRNVFGVLWSVAPSATSHPSQSTIPRKTQSV